MKIVKVYACLLQTPTSIGALVQTERQQVSISHLLNWYGRCNEMQAVTGAKAEHTPTEDRQTV